MIAAEANAVAQTNARFYRFLDNMLKGGGYGGLALAFYPVAASVRDHHIRPAIERRAAQRAGLIEEQEEFPRPVPHPVEPEPIPPAEVPVSPTAMVPE
jgi:hypothetical protein